MADGHEPAEWEPVARAIKVARTRLGWERKELAERSGLSYPYLSEIESGRKRPSTRALMTIARALGISMGELLEEAESVAPEPGVWSGPTLTRARAWAAERQPLEPEPRARNDEAERLRLIRALTEMLERLPPDDLDYVLQLVRRLAHRHR